MTYLIILAAVAVVPALIITAFRVNGAIAFMSLCLGSVLVNYTSADVTAVVSGFSAKYSLSTHQMVQLVLLVLPFLLTILFTRKSVGGSKKITNVLPALASGLLFALLAIPLLSANLQNHLEGLSAWRQLSNMQTAVVLGGAAFSLLFLLFTHRPHRSGEKRGKH